MASSFNGIAQPPGIRKAIFAPQTAEFSRIYREPPKDRVPGAKRQVNQQHAILGYVYGTDALQESLASKEVFYDPTFGKGRSIQDMRRPSNERITNIRAAPPLEADLEGCPKIARGYAPLESVKSNARAPKQRYFQQRDLFISPETGLRRTKDQLACVKSYQSSQFRNVLEPQAVQSVPAKSGQLRTDLTPSPLVAEYVRGTYDRNTLSVPIPNDVRGDLHHPAPIAAEYFGPQSTSALNGLTAPRIARRSGEPNPTYTSYAGPESFGASIFVTNPARPTVARRAGEPNPTEVNYSGTPLFTPNLFATAEKDTGVRLNPTYVDHHVPEVFSNGRLLDRPDSSVKHELVIPQIDQYSIPQINPFRATSFGVRGTLVES